MYKPMKVIVHNYLKEIITKNDIVVDATIGNGNDTLLLANLAKFVYGFDIQDGAINNTNTLLKTNHINNYRLIKDSHYNLYKYLSDFKVIVFNLGYLPKGDKTITTTHEETLKTIKLLNEKMKNNSSIVITCYVGHEEGKKEAYYLNQYLETLNDDFYVIKHLNENSPTSPFVVIIEKNKN